MFLEVNCLNVVMLFFFELIVLVDGLVEVEDFVLEIIVDEFVGEGVFGIVVFED